MRANALHMQGPTAAQLLQPGTPQRFAEHARVNNADVQATAMAVAAGLRFPMRPKVDWRSTVVPAMIQLGVAESRTAKLTRARAGR
jgi:hypothetical protein